METSTTERNAWPHRLAAMLVCVVFPLIWVGGLVTTYDAGMAVPDWPTTYGYNLFLYPWQTWLSGPWDLFIEHGHRLLGSLAGVLTIVLVVTLWRYDHRRWVCWLGLAALGLVVLQGVLGGMRVLFDETRLAMVHGCVGPVFFALCIGLVAVTSRWWHQGSVQEMCRMKCDDPAHAAFSVCWSAGMLSLLALLQIILGAQLRHLPVDAAAGSFRMAVMAHLVLAVILAIHGLYLAGKILLSRRTSFRNPALAICFLIGLQWCLGAGTWVVKYSWPTWIAETNWTASFTIRAEGLLQALTITAHVANGSLILATSVWLTLRALCFSSWRQWQEPKPIHGLQETGFQAASRGVSSEVLV